jgi:hypothetical protein
MVDQIDGSRFVDEAARHLGALRLGGAQNLNGYAAMDGLIDPLKDRAHAAFPNLADDAVRSNGGGQLGHLRNHTIGPQAGKEADATDCQSKRMR